MAGGRGKEERHRGEGRRGMERRGKKTEGRGMSAIRTLLKGLSNPSPTEGPEQDIWAGHHH
jgi:hypothetical protein